MFWTWSAFSKMQCFLKRCSEVREQYFWDFWFAPRKMSRWKNSFVFQRLMFLYQLVNLVLETCFIFSKTLKLSKTFLSWVSRLVRSFDQRALWFPYSRLFFGKMFDGQSVRCYQTFLWVWSFTLLLQLPHWSPCRDLFYLKESVTWCLYQGKMRFFYCYCLFSWC